jgi:D-glycero-beta-D-manno-heptose-7-phosphate kinase
MTILNKTRAGEILRRVSDVHVLVVGDIMLDRYLHGHVRRISPEAPVPIVQVTHEKAVPGGASNVAWNIQALGGHATLAGVVGRDNDAETLLALLREGGVRTEGIVAAPDMRTTVKTRIVAERQQVVRVDFEEPLAWMDTARLAFENLIEEQIRQADGVVIEDYGKGVVIQELVNRVLLVSKSCGIPVGYDPKSGHALDVHGITVATPNRMEAYDAMELDEPFQESPPLEDESLLAMTEQLHRKWGTQLLMVTLGAHGMLLRSGTQPPAHIPTRAREVFDVSGAGDTVIAVCTCALAAGATHQEAAELANFAAGLVVAKLGTATCSTEELLDAIP